MGGLFLGRARRADAHQVQKLFGKVRVGRAQNAQNAQIYSLILLQRQKYENGALLFFR